MDELPDATAHAIPAPQERPVLVLEMPAGGRKPRKPSKAEELYQQLQRERLARCSAAGVTAVDEHWPASRQNSALGPLVHLPEDEADLLNAAWDEYLADESRASLDVPWGLGFFLASRSTWEGRALKAAGGGA